MRRIAPTSDQGHKRAFRLGAWAKRMVPAALRPALASKNTEDVAHTSKQQPLTFMEMARLAQHMKGSNPTAALSKEQVERMEELLQYERNLSKTRNMPNPMISIMEKQLEQLKRATAGAKSQGASTARLSAKGSMPNRPSGRNLPPSTSKRPLQPAMSPSARVAPPPPRPPPTTKTTSATNDGLSPELEALFSELREMRRRKNDYKAKCEAAQASLKLAGADIDRLNAVEADLRARLKRAEHEVSLLGTEAIELKERAKRGRLSTTEARSAKEELQRVRAERSEWEAKQRSSASVERALTAEVQQLRRRLDRQRKLNPAAAFFTSASSAITAVGKHDTSSGESATDIGSSLTALETAETSVAEDELQNLASSLSVELKKHCVDAALRCGGERAAMQVVRAFWVRAVPFAAYDATLLVEGEKADRLIALLISDGRFDVGSKEETSNDGVFSIPLHCKPSVDSVFPTAAARALLEARGEELGIHSVAPFLSTNMLKDERRCEIRVAHTRSPGPGGQAANVSETNITATLVVDGHPVTRANSHDSRSAQSNLNSAKQKLYDKGIPRFNHTIAKPSSLLLRLADGNLPKPIDEATWSAFWDPMLAAGRKSGPITEAMVGGFERFSVER